MEIIFFSIYFTIITIFIIWKLFEEVQSQQLQTQTLKKVHQSLQELAQTYQNKQKYQILDHIKQNMKILSQIQEQFLNSNFLCNRNLYYKPKIQ
ncbi:unnamed protein product [Paramecium sonneborni]|uniref:Transmembrane protein n=1 Tax=Paramecium sonneborni TaxID=65129 RepID=A0A8S1QPD0_9CILI|nr:unnamed protein product [Paramecium sonneborni]